MPFSHRAPPSLVTSSIDGRTLPSMMVKFFHRLSSSLEKEEPCVEIASYASKGEGSLLLTMFHTLLYTWSCSHLPRRDVNKSLLNSMKERLSIYGIRLRASVTTLYRPLRYLRVKSNFWRISAHRDFCPFKFVWFMNHFMLSWSIITSNLAPYK